MPTPKTPLALFVYNRPQYAQAALESLSRCHRLDECQLFIFCDGAKSAEQEQSVAATRQAVRPLAKKLGAEMVERSQNLGLARSIITGVGDLCRQYGRVIVVEDDHLHSPSFIDFMLQGLDRYQDEEKVAQISGYMFPVKQPQKPDAFFLPCTTVRGWATWQRVWSLCDWGANDAPQALQDADTRHRFDLEGTYPYTQMLVDRLEGKNNSWGILFYWFMFKANRLTLHPRHSLVWTGGLEGSGIHVRMEDHEQTPRRKVLNFTFEKPLVFPEKIEVDEAAYQRVKKFLRKRHEKPPLWKYYRRVILNKLIKIKRSFER